MENTQTFIDKANQVHNNRYDYSKSEYINNSIKITVICSEHGEFYPLPRNHIDKKTGCPECAGVTLKNTEYFINKANNIHNNKYDYSKVNYINSKTPVCIVCSKHGEFWQTPHNHYKQQNCPKCSRENVTEKSKSSAEEFIQKSKKVHGDKFDYSKVIYIRALSPVLIICKDCGREFKQTPNNHLRGQGCAKCANIIQKTTEEFTKDAIKVHNNKYDYSKVEYVNAKTKVHIKCNKCQKIFEQAPGAHLVGRGCYYCSGHVTTTDMVIRDFLKTHGNRYDYSLVEYINNKVPVIILCSEHGKFKQLVCVHRNGSGCQKCCSKAISIKSQKWLDTFNITEREKLIRVNNKKKYYVDGYDPGTNTVYEYLGSFWHGDPKVYSPEGKNWVNHKQYKYLYEVTMKRLNDLKNMGYNVKYVWESDENNVLII